MYKKYLHQQECFLMLNSILVNYFMQSSKVTSEHQKTPSIADNTLPLSAIKANSAVNPCWKQSTDKVHFK